MPATKNFSDEVSEWCGQLILAIGEGKFREQVAAMLFVVSREAYDRGLADANKKD